MINTVQKVESFHRVFSQPINDKPHISDPKLNAFRVRLIEEELIELHLALTKQDPILVLDALTDLQYVLDGAYVSLGFAKVKEEAFMRVHISNMSKMGPTGEPNIREDGKILKPEGWLPPDFSGLCDAS